MKNVEAEIKRNGLEATYNWVKEIAGLTGNKSGMFGIGFPKLIAYLELRRKG